MGSDLTADERKAIEMAVQKLAGTFQKDIVSIFVCNVDSVNEAARTCDCTAISGDADTQIPGVQLMAEVNDGMLLIPAIDSTVIVALSTRNTAFVLMYSDLDKVKIITATLTQFNDGSFEGLVTVSSLTEKLNNLEDLVNDLISKYNTHIHTGVTTGAGSSGTTPQTEPDSLTPTTQSEIENTRITHGI